MKRLWLLVAVGTCAGVSWVVSAQAPGGPLGGRLAGLQQGTHRNIDTPPIRGIQLASGVPGSASASSCAADLLQCSTAYSLLDGATSRRLVGYEIQLKRVLNKLAREPAQVTGATLADRVDFLMREVEKQALTLPEPQ